VAAGFACYICPAMRRDALWLVGLLMVIAICLSFGLRHVEAQHPCVAASIPVPVTSARLAARGTSNGRWIFKLTLADCFGMTYECAVVGDSRGASYTAILTDEGQSITRDGRMSADEWHRFLKQLTYMNPWEVTSRPTQHSDHQLFRVSITDGLHSHKVEFHADERHKSLLKFLHATRPGRVYDEIINTNYGVE